MARNNRVRASNVEDALRQAVALLTKADEDSIDVKVSGPDLDGIRGRVLVEVAPPKPERTQEEEEPVTPEMLEKEADAAADFLEGFLDALDLPGDMKIRVSEEHAEVELIEVDTGALIGRRGQTLESLQELLRCSMQRQFQRRCRVRIDVEGYRARRMERINESAQEAIDEVLENGGDVRLEPMDVFERKHVHGLVAAVDGLESRSTGREPGRRVIVEAAD